MRISECGMPIIGIRLMNFFPHSPISIRQWIGGLKDEIRSNGCPKKYRDQRLEKN